MRWGCEDSWKTLDQKKKKSSSGESKRISPICYTTTHLRMESRKAKNHYLGSRQLRRECTRSPMVASSPSAFWIRPATPRNLSYLCFSTCNMFEKRWIVVFWLWLFFFKKWKHKNLQNLFKKFTSEEHSQNPCFFYLGCAYCLQHTERVHFFYTWVIVLVVGAHRERERQRERWTSWARLAGTTLNSSSSSSRSPICSPCESLASMKGGVRDRKR